MDKQGLLIVISAPSGSGKTTLCEKLVSACPDIVYSISATTRLSRKGEKDGKDYFFLKIEEFEKKKRNNEFLEWANVFGEYYGTPRRFIDKMRKKGKDVILNVDVQGAFQVKKIHPEAVFIFLLPPSMDILKQRLRNRRKDSAKEISKRLRFAKSEIAQINNYDYVIINKSITKSLRKFLAIIDVEKSRIKQMKVEINDLYSS
ncbi:MAG: guanylate kinase [Candidatus Omnitrophota bacterium]|nr:guanylate kinase [Candidatus Omnitrophota bacterium]